MALLLAFFMGNRFLAAIDPTLVALTANRLLRPRKQPENASSGSDPLLHRRLERWLNDRARIAVGTLAAVISALYYWQKGNFVRPASSAGLLAYLDVALYLVPVAYVYFLGVLAWRMGVIAVFFWSVTRTHHIVPQLLHPDHLCGFAVIGELCLRIIYVAVVPALVSGVFLLWPYIPLLSRYGSPNETLEVFARGILCAGIVGLLLGWGVLWKFHKAIVDYLGQWQIDIAQLADRLIAEKQSVLSLAANADVDLLAARLKRIAELQQLYDSNRHVRTWPLDRAKAVRLWGSVVILAGQVAAVMETFPRILGALGGP